MTFNLSGKTAVVTGAAADGLGRAHALALGKSGAKIAVLDIRECSETVAFLEKNGITAKPYLCDITNSETCKNVTATILKDFGKIDILVNNAGILDTVGFFADIPAEKWNRDVNVNLIGTANITRAIWPHLLQQNSGRVIFISSIAGSMGGAGQTSYAATKAAVVGFAKSLAIEGAKFGITANAVAPGVTDTETVGHFIRDDMKDRMKKRSALKRFAKPEEIANAVVFLASDESSYITGQLLTVDGGTGLFLF